MSISNNAAQILAIPETQPERLYPSEPRAAHQQFRKLAGRWHPDRCSDPRASDVVAHITALYRAAGRKRRSGLWVRPGAAELSALDGRHYVLRHRAARSFELGQIFIGDAVTAFVIGQNYADLFQNGVARSRHHACADPRMAAEIERYLPRPLGTVECAQWHCLVLRKEPGLLRLADVLEYFEGQMDPRHVAWILSSLLNLACYLRFAGLTHNAISSETVWISPRDHYCALLGGWWYAARIGQPMVAMPASTGRFAPAEVLRTGRADPRTDGELIRATGRALLGDAGGSRLASMKVAPRPIVDWLRMPAGPDPIEDYAHWRDKILIDAYGGRRFTALPLTADQVYPTPTPSPTKE